MDHSGTSVRIEGLRFAYGDRQIFDGLTTSFRPGLNLLVGENGVGKTTLFNLIMGRLRGTGTIELEPNIDSQVAIGFLPQTFTLPKGLTTAEFVEYMAWVRGVGVKEAPHAARDALSRVGLLDRADDRLSRLSGGMIRRAGIAQALAGGATLVLLDEPTAGLDPVQRAEVRKEIERLASKATVVASTHLLEDAAESSNLVVLGRSGLLFEGSPEGMRLLAAHGGSEPSTLEEAFLDLRSRFGP